jgi:plasmid stabilization system protein ParE
MVEIRWTPQAFNDLESIAEFISMDSPHFAKLLVFDIVSAVERVPFFPRSGRIVPEFRNPLIREIILGNFRIVYRLKGKVAEILTVYHGSRLLKKPSGGS